MKPSSSSSQSAPIGSVERSEEHSSAPHLAEANELLSCKSGREHAVTGPTSPQGHDVLEAKVLRFGQVAGDLPFGLVAAGQVENALQATVIDRRAGNHHRGGFLV